MTTQPAIVRMRRDLTAPLPPPAWPAGIGAVAFGPPHAAAVHGLLVAAYADGFGTTGPFDTWWPALANDAEYDPSLCVVAATDGGRVVAVAQCWTSAFVKDVAVAADVRRRGLGLAVLATAFTRLRDRGAVAADLKVHADNRAAIALYKRADMCAVGPD